MSADKTRRLDAEGAKACLRHGDAVWVEPIIGDGAVVKLRVGPASKGLEFEDPFCTGRWIMLNTIEITEFFLYDSHQKFYPEKIS